MAVWNVAILRNADPALPGMVRTVVWREGVDPLYHNVPPNTEVRAATNLANLVRQSDSDATFVAHSGKGQIGTPLDATFFVKLMR